MKTMKLFRTLFASYFVAIFPYLSLSVAATMPATPIQQEFASIWKQDSQDLLKKKKAMEVYKMCFESDKDTLVAKVAKHLLASDHFITAEELDIGPLFPRSICVVLKPKLLEPHAMSDLRLFMTNLYKTGSAIANITRIGHVGTQGDFDKIKAFIHQLTRMQIDTLSRMPVITATSVDTSSPPNSIKQKIELLEKYFIANTTITAGNLSQLISLQNSLYEESTRVAEPIIKACFEPCVTAVMETFESIKPENLSVTHSLKGGEKTTSCQIDAIFEASTGASHPFVSFMNVAMNKVVAPDTCANICAEIFSYKTQSKGKATIRIPITVESEVKGDLSKTSPTEYSVNERTGSATFVKKFYEVKGVPYISTLFVTG